MCVVSVTPGIPSRQGLVIRNNTKAFDWWISQPEKPLLRVRLFNYTNVDRFLDGDDDTLQVQEMGPYTYRSALRTTLKNMYIRSIWSSYGIERRQRPQCNLNKASLVCSTCHRILKTARELSRDITMHQRLVGPKRLVGLCHLYAENVELDLYKLIHRSVAGTYPSNVFFILSVLRYSNN